MAEGKPEHPSVRHEIAVVIPTVGRPILKKCLRSIVEGSELPGRIIVVDQSSNPDIRRWLTELEGLGVDAQHVPSKQTGRASAVNRGIECAEAEFVAITDDDCLVAPEWLQHMRMHLQASPDTVVTGRVEAGGEGEVPIVVTSMTPATYSRPRLKFDSLSGGNMGVALAVMKRVGLLDEDAVLRCSEDGEWAYRALRAGVKIQYAPDVVIYHYGWRDRGERQQQYREYAMSSGGFYGKYLRQGDWYIGLRAVVNYMRGVRRMIRGALARKPEDVRLGWAYVRWLVPGVLAGFRRGNPRVGPIVEGGGTPAR